MAGYDLKYLQRCQIGALDRTLNAGAGMDTITKPSIWVYDASSTGANNSAAQVDTDGYFNAATGYLSQGDLIYICCNDTSNTVAHLYNVTSTTGNATVTIVSLA